MHCDFNFSSLSKTALLKVRDKILAVLWLLDTSEHHLGSL
jgi:hypothetical protein